MVFKLLKNLKFKKLKNSQGITLVEIVVVVFIIVIFSSILIANFPKLQDQFALSRAAYELAQNLRRAEDLSLSGVEVNNSGGMPIITVKGYGIYISQEYPEQYILYADISGNNTGGDQIYDPTIPKNCSDELPNPGTNEVEPQSDCIVDTIDLTKEDTNLYIEPQIQNVIGNSTSINFNPPGPDVTIQNLNGSEAGIVLGLTSSSATRTVWVNTSGLIWVQ